MNVQRVAAAVGVIRLRQPPDVVVPRRARVPRADAHLVVESAGLVVPHAQQPFDAEAGLLREVRPRGLRAHLRREVAHADQLKVDRVARSLHELQIVTRIPPAAGGIDGFSQACQFALELAFSVDCGSAVGRGRLVIEVGGRRAQRGGDEVRPVPLALVEGQRVCQRLFIERARWRDREDRRGGRRAAGDLQAVVAGCPRGVEVERVDMAVAPAPGAEWLADGAGVHDARAGRAQQGEARARLRGPRHEVRARRDARGVPDLVHPDVRGRGRLGPRRGAEQDAGDQRGHGEQPYRSPDQRRASPGVWTWWESNPLRWG